VSLKMLNILPHTPKINFLKFRYFAYVLSLIVIIIGMVFFLGRGKQMLGVDFSGGTLEQVQFNVPYEMNDIRKAISEAGVENPQIQNFGDKDKHTLLIRTAQNDVDAVNGALDQVIGRGNYEVLRVETVGPSASHALFSKAMKAVLWAFVGIFLYLTWRFNFKYAICGIIAIIHDVLICLGLFAMTGQEMSVIVVSAILAVIGFSINDTIVIFDRVRENLKLMRKTKFKDIVNVSVNQTLSRTLLTSLTLLIAVVNLYIFGGAVINGFAFVLIVGVITGTFSTIFVASSLAVDWNKKS
jgi:preprotein translocase SecF subunit